MRQFAKKIASIFCFVLVIPCYIIYKMEYLLIRTEQPFCGMSQFFSMIPGLFGEYLRREFYKLTLKKCSSNCCISFGTLFAHPSIQIGEGVYIGTNCTIGGGVTLGKNVLLGSNVDILSGKKQHSFENLNIPIKEQKREFTKVSIGMDTWIGNGAIIMADIGDKCVIGAGSVVTHEIKAYTVAVGNPAHGIKNRQ